MIPGNTRLHDVVIPDPVAGLPFKHAMTYYGHPGFVALHRPLFSRSLIKRGTPGSLTERELGHFHSYRLALIEGMLLQLRSGAEYATGFRLGALAPERIPAAWWQLVRVDLDANTAEAHGTRLSGILIYTARCGMGDPEPDKDRGMATISLAPKKRGPRTGKGEKAQQSMLADIKSGKHSLEELAVRTSQKELAARYGAKSRDTTNKALERVSVIVGNSNSDN